MEDKSISMKLDRAININEYRFPEMNYIHQLHDTLTFIWSYRYPAIDTSRDKPPKGVILFYHGQNSNCNSMAYLGKLFAEAGYDFVGYDQKGFGRSQGLDGLIDDRDSFIKDCFNFVLKTRQFYDQMYPSHKIPFISYGYSLGAQLQIGSSRLFHSNSLINYDAMILVAPGFKANLSLVSEEMMKDIEHQAKDVNNAIEYLPFHRLNDYSIFTTYPDPLYYNGPLLARTLWTIKDMTKEDYDHFKEINCPVFTAVGNEEMNVDVGMINKFYEEVASDNKVLKIYEGEHPLLNDGWVYQDIVNDQLKWLDQLFGKQMIDGDLLK